MRVGLGYDVHPLQPDRQLKIGGVIIPYDKGASGHSDADVLIHAIIDALLGAAGLPDIGNQFPDTDPRYKGIDSGILLRNTMEMIRSEGFEIGNVDAVVSLQSPKIAAYIPKMVHLLSDLMQISTKQLSIKAKTGENIGFIGREEGLAAYAIALLINC